MESMSNAPYLLQGARDGLRMGHRELLDAMVVDGLWCSFEQCHMGTAGEVVATEYNIGRGQQDEFAACSHRKAAEAQAAGRFKAEMLSVEVPPRRTGSGKTPQPEPAVIDRDESVRPDTTAQSLGALRPAFKKDGSVTAGNAPPVNDGAAALVVMSAGRASQLKLQPMARIVGQATSGLPPKYLLMTPVEAVRKLSQKIGWRLEDVDLFELNEAFSVQALAVLRELGIDPGTVNVNGGAVALGHPIGASGARILTTLLHALKARKLKRGIATLCLGGGNGVALAVERI
jgi:acetyl-CoA C-acetyltransferase